MNIEVNLSREYSLFFFLNSNNSREMFVNSVAFSIDYAEHIQAQYTNLTQVKQVEKEKLQDIFLSYALLKTVSLKHRGNPMYVPHNIDINNMLSFLDLEYLVISYQANQPADLQL